MSWISWISPWLSLFNLTPKPHLGVVYLVVLLFFFSKRIPKSTSSCNRHSLNRSINLVKLSLSDTKILLLFLLLLYFFFFFGLSHHWCIIFIHYFFFFQNPFMSITYLPFRMNDDGFFHVFVHFFVLFFNITIHE